MNYLIILFLSLFSFQKEKTTITVAADGSGDFTTIQAAIESVKDSAAAYSTVIFIKKGVYREKVFIQKSGLRPLNLTLSFSRTQSFIKGAIAKV